MHIYIYIYIYIVLPHGSLPFPPPPRAGCHFSIESQRHFSSARSATSIDRRHKLSKVIPQAMGRIEGFWTSFSRFWRGGAAHVRAGYVYMCVYTYIYIYIYRSARARRFNRRAAARGVLMRLGGQARDGRPPRRARAAPPRRRSNYNGARAAPARTPMLPPPAIPYKDPPDGVSFLPPPSSAPAPLFPSKRGGAIRAHSNA